MVELKVIKGFTDRETLKGVAAGDIIERTQSRADELIEKGKVELIEPSEDKEEKEAPETKEDKTASGRKTK